MHDNRKLTDYLSDDYVVYPFLSKEVIIISEDKLNVFIRTYFDKVVRSKEWKADLAALITIVTTFLTTTFNDYLSISKEIWQMLFAFIAFYFFCRLLNSLRYAYECRVYSNPELLIKKLKEDSKNQVNNQTSNQGKPPMFDGVIGSK